MPSCNQCSIKSPSPCPLPKGGEEELIRFLPATPAKTLSKNNTLLIATWYKKRRKLNLFN